MNPFRLQAAAAAAALLATVLSGCAHLSGTPRAAPAATVLLISIDGFRADFLERGRTPHLSRLAREGVRARWMNPSYPTLTFPNHYTLVTGLRPDRHGIVHNTMTDPALGRFRISDSVAVGDGRWWGGEPVWVTAEKAGLPTATLFWPGSEAEINGARPRRWVPYDEDMSSAARVDRVLGWLSESATTRPRLATLYFEELDHDGHAFGPESTEVNSTLARVDAQIGRLVDELERRDLRGSVNLVIVSDHGMAPVPRARMLAVDDLVASTDATPIHWGEVLGFAPLPGRELAARRRLLGRHTGYECWDKGRLPARWHYGTHPRIPPIVCQMDVGWSAVSRERLARHAPGSTSGAHGFDPAAPSMRALFIADGPAFRDGVELPPFDNVDVYPLLTRLLQITPQRNDGNPATLEAALAR